MKTDRPVMGHISNHGKKKQNKKTKQTKKIQASKPCSKRDRARERDTHTHRERRGEEGRDKRSGTMQNERLVSCVRALDRKREGERDTERETERERDRWVGKLTLEVG
eukprot:COSAG05_NODE_1321_length_5191_cov_74.598586_7_plen_108_part_00